MECFEEVYGGWKVEEEIVCVEIGCKRCYCVLCENENSFNKSCNFGEFWDKRFGNFSIFFVFWVGVFFRWI